MGSAHPRSAPEPFPSPQVGSGQPYRQPLQRTLHVSIPSSRVGTERCLMKYAKKNSFHPLKSGRDYIVPLAVAQVARVSIPSSRVGTDA